MLIAALPPAEPPARVVAGVQVTWPLSKPETSLAPGSKLTVRIASKRRRAQVSFIRVNAQGDGLATVAKRTLRRGSFTVTVPAATGARYALRLTVAGRKRFSWVTTPVPAPPAPAPHSFCGPNNPPQARADINGTVTPASATIQAGQTLAYTVGNTGPGIFTAAGAAVLVREGESPPNRPDFGPTTLLRAGEVSAQSTVIPADTAPGVYRLSAGISWASCDVIAATRLLSEPFEVLAG